MSRILLNKHQVKYLVDVLDDPTIVDIQESNDWYAQFIPSIQFDLVRKSYVTEKQLFQIEKLAKLAKLPWRFMY